MSYKVTETNGFEYRYNKAGFAPNPVAYEATTGDYTKGQLISVSNGLAKSAPTTANAVDLLVGVCAEKKTVSSSDRTLLVLDNPMNVYECSIHKLTTAINGYIDTAAQKTSTADNVIDLDGVTAGGSTGALKGAMLYVYDGPAKGDVRTITDSTTASNSRMTVNANFSATPTTATKVVVTADVTTAGVAATGRLRIGGQASPVAGNKAISPADKTTGTGMLNVVGISAPKLRASVLLAPNKSLFGVGMTAT